MNFSPELNNHCCVSVYVCTSFFLKQLRKPLKVKQVSHTKILQSEPQAQVSLLIHPPAKPWMDYQSCRCGHAGFSYQRCLWFCNSSYCKWDVFIHWSCKTESSTLLFLRLSMRKSVIHSCVKSPKGKIWVNKKKFMCTKTQTWRFSRPKRNCTETVLHKAVATIFRFYHVSWYNRVIWKMVLYWITVLRKGHNTNICHNSTKVYNEHIFKVQ